MIQRKKFTLIELLITISIIAILASLLLPALGKVRQRSQQITCVNNLKQTGLAFDMYANDNNDFLPKYADGPAMNQNIWCAPGGPLIGAGYIQWQIVYGGNASKGYGACPSRQKMWEYSMNWHAGSTRIKKNAIKAPGGSFIVMETTASGNGIVMFAPSSSAGDVYWGHNNSINLLFCDGHVENKHLFNITTYAAPLWKSW